MISLHRHHREENQVLLAVVDKAVGVTLRAVVAVAGFERQDSAVVVHFAAAAENVDYLAVVFVRVFANGRFRRQSAVDHLVQPVKMYLGDKFALTALEIRHFLIFFFAIVYNHNLKNVVNIYMIVIRHISIQKT